MELPKRKPNRLKNFDYSQNGSYFITLCVKDRYKMLWKQDVGADIFRPHDTWHLSEYGTITNNAINAIPKHYHNIVVDKYVIMPNHIHMILLLELDNGRILSAPTKTISIIIGQLKRSISKEIRFPLWQKSFHDHIIRNEQEYQKIWQYIDTNPLKWDEDCFYALNRKK